MSKLWEIDPETRSKLQEIQKKDGNSRCVDCNAPSPQWCSPKLGVFFCLSCSGIHRSLGVHISFVRSITMDSFKVSEIQRMDKGGNNPWKEFFDAHKSNKLEGRTFEDSTIQERYDSEAGEEWKERLSCKVEGRDFDPAAVPKKAVKSPEKPPIERTSTPTNGSGGVSQKAMNEAYFARMGAENDTRPEGVAPSQGGKYAGFGNMPASTASSNGSAIPSTDEFQKDPVAALTKGFGWLGSAVSKQATAGYTGWVKPNVQKLAEGNLAEQARLAAAQVGQTVTASTKTAADSFNRFVEGEHNGTGSAGPKDPEKRDFWDSFGAAPKGPAEDKKDFWDSFAAAGEAAGTKAGGSSSIGTNAMKKNAGAGKKDDGGWGDW